MGEMLRSCPAQSLGWGPPKPRPHGTLGWGGAGAHRRLVVVLQGHGDHIEADDERDEDVQVVAGAHGVDEQPGGTVGGIVGQPLGLCGGPRGGGTDQRVAQGRNVEGEAEGREEARGRNAGSPRPGRQS